VGVLAATVGLAAAVGLTTGVRSVVGVELTVAVGIGVGVASAGSNPTGVLRMSQAARPRAIRRPMPMMVAADFIPVIYANSVDAVKTAEGKGGMPGLSLYLSMISPPHSPLFPSSAPCYVHRLPVALCA
jgi:hypothetical protein